MPKSVKYFEWAWLSSLALGIIVAALSYSALVKAGAELFAGIVQVVVFGVSLLLILLTSRKRSNIAKWVLVVLSGLGLALYIPQLAEFLELGAIGVLSSIQLLLQCVGLYFLFTEEARRWFGKTDKPGPAAT